VTSLPCSERAIAEKANDIMLGSARADRFPQDIGKLSLCATDLQFVNYMQEQHFRIAPQNAGGNGTKR